ncbi:hypothetical protein, partial [Planotetraspora mira]|uniref:hypothetical protein n=1 Tax=Planotetraspora mira TaxID=58121 RepID=UPI00194E9081
MREQLRVTAASGLQQADLYASFAEGCKHRRATWKVNDLSEPAVRPSETTVPLMPCASVEE